MNIAQNNTPRFTFSTKVWRYEGPGSWHFITVPIDISKDIQEITLGQPRKGFGSVRVIVELEGDSWNTSIFPDTKRNSYILPLKKAIRTKHGLEDGATANLTISLADMI